MADPKITFLSHLNSNSWLIRSSRSFEKHSTLVDGSLFCINLLNHSRAPGLKHRNIILVHPLLPQHSRSISKVRVAAHKLSHTQDSNLYKSSQAPLRKRHSFVSTQAFVKIYSHSTHSIDSPSLYTGKCSEA